jgi:hypothetical protein
MESVNGVSSTTQSMTPPDDRNVLASLVSKACFGDMASECMALLAEDSAIQMEADIQGIRVQQRTMRELHRRRMKLLKERLQATKNSGFWSSLGKIFSGIASAVAGALSFFCPALIPGAVGLVGSVMSGGCFVGGALYDKQVAVATADMAIADQLKQSANEASDDMLQSLENAVEVERRMAARIAAIAESEHRSLVIK